MTIYDKDLLLSDPHTWFKNRRMDHDRRFEDLHTHYQVDLEAAYLELVDAGIIKDGDSIAQFFDSPPDHGFSTLAIEN